jgi:hypothetical protein
LLLTILSILNNPSILNNLSLMTWLLTWLLYLSKEDTMCQKRRWLIKKHNSQNIVFGNDRLIWRQNFHRHRKLFHSIVKRKWWDVKRDRNITSTKFSPTSETVP